MRYEIITVLKIHYFGFWIVKLHSVPSD